MKEIPFIVPAEKEQIEIVKYIKKSLAQYDTAIQNRQQQITALEQLKTRLISDTVTGKIDVRNVAVPDFTPVEEAPDEDENPASDEDTANGENGESEE